MERAASRVPGRRRADRPRRLRFAVVAALRPGWVLVNTTDAPAEKAAPARRPRRRARPALTTLRADRPARAPPSPPKRWQAPAPRRHHPAGAPRRASETVAAPARRRRRPPAPAPGRTGSATGGPTMLRRPAGPRCRSYRPATIAGCGLPPTTSFACTRRPAPPPGRRTRPIRVPRRGRPPPAGGGEPILGVNVENASYGLTSCAERNAVFAAVGAGLRDFSAIAVHAEAGSAPPCGACRQVLAEFSPSMTVVYRSGGEVVATTAAELLPDRFEP